MIAAWLALVIVNLFVWGAGLLIAERGLSALLGSVVAMPLAAVLGFHVSCVDFLLVPHTDVFGFLFVGLTIPAIASWHGGGRALP